MTFLARKRPARAALSAMHTGTAGPVTVLVHGFTQTHVSWAPVTRNLVRDHWIVGVDLPGHGGSTEVRTDLSTGADLLGDVAHLAIYVGYSLGGRLALRLALDRPDRVAALVLVGATAGIDDPDERAARRVSDEALADRIERDGVAPFLDGWLAQPLFSGLVLDPADRTSRLENRPDGLASSLRLAGTGTMDPPWWGELAGLSVPTLVVAGERDLKFTALGQRLADAIGPGASFATVAGAGHAAHLQAPSAFANLVRRFTAGLPEAPSLDRWM